MTLDRRLETPWLRACVADEGIVVVELRGELRTAGEAEDCYDAVKPMLIASAPALVLVMFTHFHEASLSARWAIAMRMKRNADLTDRVAWAGLQGDLLLVASIVVRASGRRNVSLFQHRSDAVAWLLQSQPG